MKRRLLAVALLCAAPLPGAAHPLPSPALDRTSELEIAFSSDLWEAPLAVALPVRVHVRNRAPRARRLELVFTATTSRADTCRTRQEVLVAARSTAMAEVVVGLCPRDASHPFWNVRLVADVRGDAVAPSIELFSRHVAPTTGGRSKMSAPLALSESVATRSWEPLRVAFEGQGVGLQGSRFSPHELPGDWRAWAGFSGVIMTGEEWRGIEAQPRNALLSWVAAGGTLFLSGEAAVPDGGGLPQASTPSWGPRGFGRIAGLEGRDAELDTAAGLPALQALEPPTLGDLPDHTTSPLSERVGRRDTPRLALAVIMLAYAAMVGPLNLWLCRGSRRPHVFWTTPLIALAACLVLAISILFRDGVGGSGYRYAALLSLPGESREVLLQEQVSRTGLLTGRAFSVRDPALLVPLPLGPPAGRRVLELFADRHSGDWFTSRSTQGQILQAVRPSRTRLTFSPGPGGPALLSSFPGRLRAVFYLDDAGQAWSAQDVPPGRSTALLRSSPAAVQQGWAQQLRGAGPRMRLMLQRVAPSPGGFYAIADSGTGAPLLAGASLRWADEPLLLVGRAK